ncbi:GTPase HflX [Novimethylophilus kurashikiensis]|uniref:GTPase HflX n=1 Tax=Novimethylophilus kurashikiensis TaxID=1825523 RepID=A0A2R5F9D2_9PROT|nr:hypothetical protein [Novimethylophilus kurashikiensis]GBG14807.1 GTPase HflX [Novimethylophilus kurashikiensis]
MTQYPTSITSDAEAAAVEAKITTAQQELEKIRGQVRDITRGRTNAGQRMVNTYLGSLSSTGLTTLARAFPGFLKAELRELYLKNIPILWIFKPSGYANALSLLKTQFLAYLDKSGQFLVEDGLLRELGLRQAMVSQELTRLVTLHAQYRHMQSMGVKSPVIKRSTTIIEEDDEDVQPYLVDIADDEILNLINPPSVVIATDDSLGYYS